ncbi:MAG: N-6 DNA methylase, partial [Kiritimatiellota bacterium]|nr:N-6 DNA methylase [Kiritimatiellota bacterium]
MQTRTHNPFTTIHTEGALLPADLLQRVLAVDPKLDGLSAADYHLPAGEKPNEAINRSWNRLQGSWAAFRAMRERLGIGDFATGETRDRWLLPLFQELGYGRLQTAKAIELDGKSYPISHRWSETPIHLVGCGIKLDQRTAGAAGASRSSPHSLLQELLNRSPELLWGMVSNGLRLRVLRDNASLTRQAFLEFDLESMFEGEIYSDFAVLWLFCHQSRVEVGADGVRPCWLEAWSKVAQEQGLRALESLRQGVEGAIAALGSGFLRAPANQTLRLDLRSGTLGTQQYYRQLLRLVYRLIFLFVAEDRDLLFDPHSSPEARGRYLQHYSLARMRHMAERSRGGRHPDLYTALRLVTDILGGRKDSVSGKTGLGLPVLGGFLFSRLALPDLESAELENESLLSAIRHLTFMEQGRTHRVVDYKNLGARELGSVYESLLELHPLVNTDAATFELTAVSGSERKTTGSFFTPEELISLLLDSALNPVIAQALAGAGSSIEKQIAALLNLKICDPACGSGHFLLAAARKLARLLAQLRTGEGEPAPEAMRAALREVISNCIYGVDINPMSVELCKVSLWMEALEPGKPLSFLDAHIQCGDSLVGVSPNLDISEIPDEAFNPAFGDDKATASALKKRNKRERTGQLGMRFDVAHQPMNMDELTRWLVERATQVDAMPEDDP